MKQRIRYLACPKIEQVRGNAALSAINSPQRSILGPCYYVGGMGLCLIVFVSAPLERGNLSLLHVRGLLYTLSSEIHETGFAKS
jgi:hypothetical protein